MDPKSTAKSKRSHSQQGRRNNPHLSTPTTEKKNPQKHKQTQHGAQQPPRPTRPSLPSNWDRYEGDVEFESEEQQRVVEKGFVGVGSGTDVVPKSKGADFVYLIEQARDGAHGLAPSFDDSVPEYLQGLSPILSIRGNSLMLQRGNDNFVVDDDATSTSEMPFLSLDLHILAAKLAKVKLSRRLFLDPIYLPEEMDTTGSNESTIRKAKLEDSSNKVEGIHGLISAGLQGDDDEKGKTSDAYGGSKTTKVNDAMQAIPNKPSLQGHIKQIHTSDSDYLECNKVIEAQECSELLNQQKTSRFQASTAEAELDMLLNSLEETKLSDFSSTGTSLNNNSLSQLASLDFCATKVHNSSNYAPETVSLDSTVDLLVGTKPGPFCIDAGPRNMASQDASLTRYVASGVSLEDTIDSLPSGTSADPKDGKYAAHPRIEPEMPSSFASSSSSASFTKALDDFDSWLDTI